MGKNGEKGRERPGVGRKGKKRVQEKKTFSMNFL